MAHTAQSTGYIIGNSASQAHRVLLTGEREPAAQREACRSLSIQCLQRRIALPDGRHRLIDECIVPVDERVYIMIREAERQAECARWLSRRAANRTNKCTQVRT